MGIYIKGMKMPKNCGECLLTRLSPTGESLICNYMLSRVSWEERPFDCPLIPIPPHGRLGDLDALYENCVLDHDYDVMATTTRINEYMQLKIDGAPTIIPAE